MQIPFYKNPKEKTDKQVEIKANFYLQDLGPADEYWKDNFDDKIVE